MDAPTKITQLREALNYHIYRYYVLEQPTLSDGAYDALFDQLVALEAAHPDLVTADSPTQRVGGGVQDKFVKVTHPAPMLSLAKATEPAELIAWESRNRKLLPEDTLLDYIVEPKIDGLTVVLHYENGVFVQGATRGNGEIGEDITQNLRTLNAVPGRIPVDPDSDVPPPARLVVRGEAYFPLDKWAAFNDALAEAGEKTYMNPRNAASGSLRQLDSSITAARPLTLFVYDFVVADGIDIPTQADRLNYLRQIGFPVAADSQPCATIEEVIATYQAWLTKRNSINYEVDGLVIKINDQTIADRLGFTGKDPRGAVAMKFPAQEKTTKLLAADVNVGRTGTLAPLARLEPVELGGVIVRNATLHNYSEIANKDIRIGDTVIVKRAGDVIPYIVGPVPELRDGSEQIITPPAICPACGSPATQPEGEIAIYCDNAACPDQLVRRIEYFVGRTAMDIGGFGTKTGGILVENGLVSDIASIYTLDQQQDELLALEGFKAKKVDNLLTGIAASKAQPADRVLTAIGIRYVGGVIAKLLLAHVGSIDALGEQSADQLEAIDGVGPQIARSITTWFANERNRDLIARLKAADLQFTLYIPTSDLTNASLADRTFVITGTLPTLSRTAAKALIEQHGGKVTSAVSQKTGYLLAGEKAGSKRTKAEKLNIPILDEAALLTMIDERL